MGSAKELLCGRAVVLARAAVRALVRGSARGSARIDRRGEQKSKRTSINCSSIYYTSVNYV
jgi:hypothetical protein